MTLYLPNNLPKSQVVHNYVFGHNVTHMGLVIDYGSLLNHHESANVKALTVSRRGPNLVFLVRRGFHCTNRNVLNISMYECMHTYTNECTYS